MRIRTAALLGCFILALGATPAQAKKKKKKGAALGPVVTVAAQGNTTTTSPQRSTAIAICPSGTMAVGGGFSAPFSTATLIVVDNSYRSSNESWLSSGEHVSGTGAVTAYAYCRRGTRPVTDATGMAAIPPAIFATGTATSTCPGGTQLISGGFQTTPGGLASPFVNMRTAPGTWTVSSANNGSDAQTLTAHAYCMSGIKPPVSVTGTAAAAVQMFGTVSASSAACPAPKKRKKKGKKKRKAPRQVISAGGFSGSPPMGASPLATFTDSRAGTGVWTSTAVNGVFSTGNLLVSSQGICL
jgi:hypothetical protein